MTESRFPRRTSAAATAEFGVCRVATVAAELGWIFRRTPQESDYGIDGYLDVIAEDGSVTGKSIAVQIKTGASYFGAKSPSGWWFKGEHRHLNYYLNSLLPVIIVLVDERGYCWWRLVEAYETERHGGQWAIEVPSESAFNRASRSRLEAVVGAHVDYIPHLSAHWELLHNSSEYDLIFVRIERFEIDTLNTQPFRRLFEKMASRGDLVRGFMRKIDFVVGGFDEDPREIFQIPEVVAWLKKVSGEVTTLAYFLSLSELAQGFPALIYCLTSARLVAHGLVELEKPEEILHFMDVQFEGLNRLTEECGIDDLNEFCSKTFADALKKATGIPG